MSGALSGKVALVTGAAEGIGLACAQRFVAEGARVLLTDVQETRGRAQAEALGDAAAFAPLDVRDEAQWTAAIEAAQERFGGLDVLVNNAGVSIMADLEAADLAHWRLVLGTNLDGVYLGCRLAMPLLKRSGGGAIVNIGSALGVRPRAEFPAYSASKAALFALSKSVALLGARLQPSVRVNTVIPGSVDTAMSGRNRTSGTRAEQLARNAASHPLGRIARPEEIAAAVLFLASDQASFITGAELAVDGGLTI